MIEINKIYNENCLETMSKMPDNFLNLTITSPPYDNLRDYKGYSFDFKAIADELYRVTKPGGTIVWVVNDATIKGSETGSSFKQALYFKEIGFNLHDTMIWNKGSFTAIGSLQTRYAPVFEYMFILTKGKIKTFNPLKDRKNLRTGKINGSLRKRDGSIRKMSNHGKIYNKYGQRFNVWNQSSEMRRVKNSHPAPFPEQLIVDHIISWSNEKDLIYDPFMGGGTTASCCVLTNRNYLGSEISKEYCEMIEKRIKIQKQACALRYI